MDDGGHAPPVQSEDVSAWVVSTIVSCGKQNHFQENRMQDKLPKKGRGKQSEDRKGDKIFTRSFFFFFRSFFFIVFVFCFVFFFS